MLVIQPWCLTDINDGGGEVDVDSAEGGQPLEVDDLLRPGDAASSHPRHSLSLPHHRSSQVAEAQPHWDRN